MSREPRGDRTLTMVDFRRVFTSLIYHFGASFVLHCHLAVRVKDFLLEWLCMHVADSFSREYQPFACSSSGANSFSSAACQPRQIGSLGGWIAILFSDKTAFVWGIPKCPVKQVLVSPVVYNADILQNFGAKWSCDHNLCTTFPNMHDMYTICSICMKWSRLLHFPFWPNAFTFRPQSMML